MEKSTAQSNQNSNLSSPCMNIGPSSSDRPAAKNIQLRIKAERDLELDLSLNGQFGVDMSTSSKKQKHSHSIATPPCAIKSHVAAANAPIHGHHAPPAVAEGVSNPTPLMRFSSYLATQQTMMDDHRNASGEARKVRIDKMRRNKRLMRNRTNKVHGGAGHSRPSASGRSRNVAKSTLPPSRKYTGSSSSIDHNSSAGGQQDRSNVQIEGANQGVAAPQIQVQAANGSVNARIAQQLDQGANGNATPANVMYDEPANGNANAGNALPHPMPYVSTKVDGHRRVFGFLYRYTAEEVKIACVCHAMLFTPAEFVEHGCGYQVEHPLQKIWVMPFPSRC